MPRRHCIAILFGTALLLVATSLAAPVRAQGSRADYQRAAGLQAQFRGKVYRDRVEPHWLTGGGQFWYEVATGPDKREWILVDTEPGERRPAFDHAKLANALSSAAEKSVAADALPLRSFELSDDAASAEFTAFDKRWKCDLATYALQELGSGESSGTTVGVLDFPRRSRNGGASTSIRFVNRTAGTVRLVWVDAAGGRTPYGTLDAGQARDQHTYAGHVWLVTDADERPLAVFEATDDAGAAVIDGSQRVRGRRRSGRRGRRRDGGGARSPDGRWQAVIKDDNGDDNF